MTPDSGYPAIRSPMAAPQKRRLLLGMGVAGRDLLGRYPDRRYPVAKLLLLLTSVRFRRGEVAAIEIGVARLTRLRGRGGSVAS